MEAIADVTASVNLLARTATIDAPEGCDVEELCRAVEGAGYFAAEANSGAHAEVLAAESSRLRSLGRRLALAVPLAVLLAVTSLSFVLVPSTRFPGWQSIPILCALPIVTWAAWPLHAAALRGARHRTVTMDTLVSLGITVATGWAVVALFESGSVDPGLGWRAALGSDIGFLATAAGITVLVLSGRWIERRVSLRTAAAVGTLAEADVKTVVVVNDSGQRQRIPLGDIEEGQRFLVRSGEMIVADGLVIDGEASVDLATLTGESGSTPLRAGTAVSAGTVVREGRLIIEAASRADTLVSAGPTRVLEPGLTGRSELRRLADRLVTRFVPAVLLIAAVTTTGWLVAGATPARAVTAGIAVLVVACPCALGLATPAALLAAVGRGARTGILIGDEAALERAGRIDIVLFDKTGTLTHGADHDDRVRDSAAGAIAELHRQGLHTVLLTGDNPYAAQAVADRTGITDVHAGLLPEDKVEVIRGLRELGYGVAMVGDGVNDGPALAAADLGIALSGGADAAIAASDMVLVGDDLAAVPASIALARATAETIRGNMIWALGYNLISIPFAVGGLLDPLAAAAAMALSSLFVISNSLRLR